MAGPNDSQVPLASQCWGDPVLEVRADHFEIIGWSFASADPATARPFDHLGALRRLLDDTLAL
jgi:triacylglycerol lipase